MPYPACSVILVDQCSCTQKKKKKICSHKKLLDATAVIFNYQRIFLLKWLQKLFTFMHYEGKKNILCAALPPTLIKVTS